jgi:hypothetical protein
VVTAFITIGETWTEEPLVVGTVTSWARHPGKEPYATVDDEDPGAATMSLESGPG